MKLRPQTDRTRKTNKRKDTCTAKRIIYHRFDRLEFLASDRNYKLSFHSPFIYLMSFSISFMIANCEYDWLKWRITIMIAFNRKIEWIDSDSESFLSFNIFNIFYAYANCQSISDSKIAFASQIPNSEFPIELWNEIQWIIIIIFCSSMICPFWHNDHFCIQQQQHLHINNDNNIFCGFIPLPWQSGTSIKFLLTVKNKWAYSQTWQP